MYQLFSSSKEQLNMFKLEAVFMFNKLLNPMKPLGKNKNWSPTKSNSIRHLIFFSTSKNQNYAVSCETRGFCRKFGDIPLFVPFFPSSLRVSKGVGWHDRSPCPQCQAGYTLPVLHGNEFLVALDVCYTVWYWLTPSGHFEIQCNSISPETATIN